VNKILKNSSKLLLWPASLASLLFQSFRTRWRIGLLHQRESAITFCAEPSAVATPRLRVLAVVTHVVSPEDVKSASKEKLHRLITTLEAALVSFAHCELKIIINTVPQRHLTAFLPDHLRRRIEVVEQPNCDPMYIEFLVPDLFLNLRGDHDWFLFLEDDIVLRDSWALEKLAFFNGAAGDPSLLLTPHRFEMLHGEKVYFDLRWSKDFKEFAWNRFATFGTGGVKFGECANSHAACFCLNREQLDLWERSGRHWKNRVVITGPLESAATGCLFEAFTIYKPHADNLRFLEVEHCDTKYSRMLAAGSVEQSV